MKKALAVGDRVRVYEATLEPWVGKVVQVGNIAGAEYVHVKAGNETYQVHPLQCRRRRATAKPAEPSWEDRLRLEAKKAVLSDTVIPHTVVLYHSELRAMFRDGARWGAANSKPGIRVVSREELAKAWDEKVCFSEPVCPTDESSSGFHVLCKALGFPKEPK